MRGHEVKTAANTNPRLSLQAVDRQKKVGTFSVQRDPLTGVSCRIGDASCARAHASTLNRATTSQPTRSVQSLLRLQRQYGNRYVQRVLALARKADGKAEVAPEVEETIQQVRGGRQALDSRVRAQMEAAFGADFSSVRVHTGPEADALNRALSARAFTTGRDIFFREGEYNPSSSTGRELLAHELTHVVQQNGAEVQRELTISQPDDRYEQEANQAAREVMQWEQEGDQQEASEGASVELSPLAADFNTSSVAILPQSRKFAVPSIQRVLPAAAGAAAAGGAAVTEPIEVIAALASIASLAAQAYSGGSGGLSYSSDAADRLSEDTQPKDHDYEAICLDIGAMHPILPNVYASFKVVWEGNNYGEIGAARVLADIGRTSEFILSSLNVTFRAYKNLIQPGADKRTWQIQWGYEGTFDPMGAGEYWFQGDFAIDAFGNFTSLGHTVRDLTFGIVRAPGTSIARPGAGVSRPIPPPPPRMAGAAPPAPPGGRP